MLLVDAASATDPGWMQVQELRRRFAHARLRVVVIGEHAESVAAPYVHAVTSVDSARHCSRQWRPHWRTDARPQTSDATDNSDRAGL